VPEIKEPPPGFKQLTPRQVQGIHNFIRGFKARPAPTVRPPAEVTGIKGLPRSAYAPRALHPPKPLTPAQRDIQIHASRRMRGLHESWVYENKRALEQLRAKEALRGTGVRYAIALTSLIGPPAALIIADLLYQGHKRREVIDIWHELYDSHPEQGQIRLIEDFETATPFDFYSSNPRAVAVIEKGIGHPRGRALRVRIPPTTENTFQTAQIEFQFPSPKQRDVSVCFVTRCNPMEAIWESQFVHTWYGPQGQCCAGFGFSQAHPEWPLSLHTDHGLQHTEHGLVPPYHPDYFTQCMWRVDAETLQYKEHDLLGIWDSGHKYLARSNFVAYWGSEQLTLFIRTLPERQVLWDIDNIVVLYRGDAIETRGAIPEAKR